MIPPYNEDSFKLNISNIYIYIHYFELNVGNSLLQERFGHEIPFGVQVHEIPVLVIVDQQCLTQTVDPHLVVFLFLIFQKIIAQH